MEKNINFIGCHVRPFMENAHLHGYNVFASDGYGDWDATLFGKVVYKSQKEFGCWNDVLGSYKKLPEGPLLFCGPIEAEPSLLETASRERKVINPPAEAVSKTRQLSFLAEMATGGISFPEIATAEGSRQPDCIIKSVNGAGGTKIREDDENLSDGEYRQRFVKGISIGVSYLSVKGTGDTELLGVSRHIMGEPEFSQSPFMFGGLIYPEPVSRDIVEALKNFGSRVAQSSGLCGLWGADFIITDDHVFLLEINPRPTASMELIANLRGIDLVAAQVEALGGQMRDIDAGRQKVLATAACYARTDCRMENQQIWFELGARDIPMPDKKINAGEPLISLYAESDTADSSVRKLRELAKKLYADVAECRVP